MKPNEYIKKYDLCNNKRFNYEDFVIDLAADLNAITEYYRSNWSRAKFDNCVSDLRNKFNSIANKSGNNRVNEFLWAYLYGIVIGPAKSAMFDKPRKSVRYTVVSGNCCLLN